MDGKGAHVRNLRRLFIFLLFPVVLVGIAYLLLKPSGETRAQDKIRDVSVTILQAEEFAKQTNDQQDKHNVGRARETLDRARSLIIENSYSEAIETATKAEGFARLVLDRGRRSNSDDDTTTKVRFDELIGDVQFRRADDTDYTSATKKTILDVGDVVKTSPKASCRLVFYDGMITVVGPASLITIKDAYANRSPSENFINLRLETGELTLKSTEIAGKAKPSVLTKSGSAMVYHSSQIAVEYSAIQSATELSVYQGRATAAAGTRSVDLSENQRVLFSDDLSMGELVDLPPPPKLVRPTNFSEIQEGEGGTTQVILGWTAIDPTASYHIELSPNILFTEWIHEDQRYFRNQIDFPNLPPGVYFWRVASVDSSNVEGAPSNVWQFQVGKELITSARAVDNRPPKLTIDEISVHGYLVIISGKTEKTATVQVDGQKAILDINTGEFNYTANMKKDGVHKINIVATDPAGNRTLEERFVEIKD